MSPSSLRYYGLGLQKENYTIKLQFAEIGIILDLRTIYFQKDFQPRFKVANGIKYITLGHT
ncbi:hypothetical protein IEQ34_008254 [Dendrobium chrysotoxum]|uniref:Malectin domain-containing protein n=1 Tax=Dendrobium chrysotoxum TaxID=161865 RepID=A0AAV7H5M5_DENCH|nr:hypothetical protein IEQ34_008254 [Dendrobium chrysotoxum]